MLLAQFCSLDADLPPGTIGPLNGAPGPITDALMDDVCVRELSFTGSIRVGQIIAAAAKTLKQVTMELGGHVPVIVMDDVNVDAVAKLCAQAKFRNAGQVCIAPSRFLVMDAIAKDLTLVFAEAASQVRVGHGTEDWVEMGPLAIARRRAAVEELVQDAVDRGARLPAGGHRPQGFNRGNFYAPTVLDDVDAKARIMQEEPFGPVAPSEASGRSTKPSRTRTRLSLASTHMLSPAR